MHTGLTWREIERDLSLQLQSKHQELISLLSTKKIVNGKEYLENERLVNAVNAQQAAWEKFKDTECELIGALSMAASTWQSANAARCSMNLTDQRLTRMRDAVRCVKRIAPEDRRFSQTSCLYQIAPLAVPLETLTKK